MTLILQEEAREEEEEEDEEDRIGEDSPFKKSGEKDMN